MACSFSGCSDIPFSVFWDTDGTKVDSEPVHEIRWERVAAAHGVRLTADMFDKTHTFLIPDETGKLTEINRPLRGAHEDVICHWIIHQMRRQGKKQFPTLPEMKIALLKEYRANAHLIRPRPGIPRLMNRLRKEGDWQATVTGCHREIAEINLLALKKVPLTSLAFVITADHTTKHKPAPDPYYLAFEQTAAFFGGLCNRCDVTADMVAGKAMIVEDSPSGVRAGLQAGVPVVQFLNPGQTPFPAEKEGFDPSLLHVAKTADEIYKHRCAIRAARHHKSCRIRRHGCGFSNKQNIQSLFLGA